MTSYVIGLDRDAMNSFIYKTHLKKPFKVMITMFILRLNCSMGKITCAINVVKLQPYILTCSFPKIYFAREGCDSSPLVDFNSLHSWFV